jgi:hypothetical protein
VHGAAGRVGTAALELGALAGLRLDGTCTARDRAAVERLGAVAIDYQNEDFLARVREMTGDGVDVVLDSLGGPLSLRSFRALGPGGRLVVFGRYATLSHGRKNWPAVIEWYAAIAALWLWDKLSPRRRVLAYRIQRFRDAAQRRPGAVGGQPRYPSGSRRTSAMLHRGDPEPWADSPATPGGSRRTSSRCSSCFVRTRSTRWWPSACPCPRLVALTRCSSARRRRESSYSCLDKTGQRRAPVWWARRWCRFPRCATAIASVSQNSTVTRRRSAQTGRHPRATTDRSRAASFGADDPVARPLAAGGLATCPRQQAAPEPERG